MEQRRGHLNGGARGQPQLAAAVGWGGVVRVALAQLAVAVYLYSVLGDSFGVQMMCSNKQKYIYERGRTEPQTYD